MANSLGLINFLRGLKTVIIDVGWIRPEVAKSTWDKAALVVANANNKALNANFCGVSPDEFHRISHVIVSKEAW